MPAKLARPNFSIVTPSLNQGRFLQTCIDSVAGQNWPNYEHFVIDGGSSDDTLTILERNKSRLAGFVSEPDQGAADAINKGLARCTGDIVVWLNADDFFLPGAFEKVAEAWRANPNAGFWFGNGLRVDERGETKAVFNPHRILYNHSALVEGVDYILQPATFINSSVLSKAGYLNTNLRWSFDWDLWLRLAALAPPATIQAQLAASREWEATLTASGSFRRVEELRSMAQDHSGKPMTVGALCYWLDTTVGFMRANPGSFHEETLGAAKALWLSAQSDMRLLGVDMSGMPVQEDGRAFGSFIAVDLFPLVAGVSGGIVPWVQGVLREMVRLYPEDRIVLFHRPGPPPIQIEGENVSFVALSNHPALFYESMSRYCQYADVQAVIRTYPMDQHPDLPFERQVFVIPDLQHEYYPELFSRPVLAARRRAFAYALSRGGAIATMTDHSRSTVVDNPWTMTDDVFLMPAALPDELRDSSAGAALPEQVKSFDRYFYMPANLWPHKNHRRLFEAFKRALPDLPPGTGLVLSGNPDGLAEVMEGYAGLPILHLGYVPHEQVSALFRDAAALVYFSLFEGFGMPVLEALHHGTPVLCSNTTSLPEVGGDAVLSCDPTDVDAMADLMRRILNDEDGLKEELIARAPARLAAYDWAKPAHALRAALKRRAHAKPRPKAKPLVSIVMPTRNQGHFIRESIDSVLGQNYPNVELVVMDGASTDDTVEILKSYGERIRWISEPDNGQADAINKGMSKVSGDVLAYLNSDDILLPGAIDKVVDYFNAHPECDMVYGDADYIDKDGNVTGAYATAEFSFERLMHDCCVCQPAAFWRRRAAERTGPFNADLQTAMDYEYWLRLAADGSIIHYTKQKFAQSRLHEDAKTLAMRGKIYEEVFRICREQGGYVSYSYYHGLWSYKLFESWSGGPRLRRFLPRIYRVPALVHFAAQVIRLRKDKTSRLHVARTVFHIVDQHYPRIGLLIRRAWSRSATLRRSFS